LGSDARTARFASELMGRGGEAARPVDFQPLVSALVRQAISRGDQDGALSEIERARTIADAETAAILDVWGAEIRARQGRGDAALEVYQRVIRPDGAGAAIALDGALTMIDNGHIDQAMQLLTQARNLARQAGLVWIERRARELMQN
jgi:hypothetical protein